MFSIATILIGYLPRFLSLRSSIENWLLSSLIPGTLSQGVAAYLNQFSSKAKGLTLFGLGGLFLTAIFTLITIEHAFNQVWGVKTHRGLLKKTLIYGAAPIFGPLLLGLSIYLSTVLLSASQGFTKNIPWDYEVLSTVLPMLLTVVPFLMIYKLGPNAIVKWKDAAVGGFFAAIFFELAKLGFTYFVTKMPVYKTLYGAFAVVPLFLLWIYLTWWVTMAGAVLTASLPTIRAGLPLQKK